MSLNNINLKKNIDLGINIDHVATLRNARGSSYPCPIQAALAAEKAGADLITLHLREDRRHIKDADLYKMRPLLKTRMNLECAITPEMLKIACDVRPSDVCLVPEKREEVTTEGGLDVVRYYQTVKSAIEQLQAAGIRVSLFIDADVAQIQAAIELKVPVIEIHTGEYAHIYEKHHPLNLAEFSNYNNNLNNNFINNNLNKGLNEEVQTAIQRIQTASEFATKHGIKAHAGHGLHLENVAPIAAIAEITELNIGHAIVARAIFVGWQTAIQEIKGLMQNSRL